MEPLNDTDIQPELEIGLREYWQTLVRWRRWFLGVLIVVVFAVAVYSLTATPIYEAKAKLLVQTGSPSSSAQADDVLGELTGMARARTLETQIELIRSAEVTQPALRAAGIASGKTPPTVRIEGLKATDIICIACQSPDPKLAAEFANALGDEYVRNTLDINRRTATQGLRFIEEQLDRARMDLNDAEDALKVFRQKTGIAGTNEAAASLLQRFENQLELVAQARAAVAGDAAERDAVRSKLGHPTGMVVSAQTLIRNPAIDDLRKNLRETEAERAALTLDYAPSSPQVRALDRRIAGLRSQLVGEVERVVGSEALVSPSEPSLRQQLATSEVKLLSDRERLAAAEHVLAQTKTQVNSLPAGQRTYAELQRHVVVAEQRYLSLVSKQQELDLAKESKVPSARLVERAKTPGAPIKPTTERNLAIGVVLGLLLGVGVVLLVDYIQNTYSELDEIERDLGIPVLSTVYRASAKQSPLLKAPMGRSSFAEAYRSLRYALRFAGVTRNISAIVITSAGVGEGKTTTSLNLAIAAAEGGQRTLLVDADLRRASVHKVLGISNESGLTNCLVQHGDPAGYVRATEYPNLSVLTAGPFPPNPAELLDSDSMAALVAKLRETADLVIFDTPPCLMLTDARAIAHLCDGTMLVMDIEKTKRPAIRRVVDIFNRDSLPILGVVANKIRHIPGSYYYYYHYYYRQYYGNEDRR